MMEKFVKWLMKRSDLQMFAVELTGALMTVCGTVSALNILTGGSLPREPFNFMVVFLLTGPGLLALNEQSRRWTIRLCWLMFIVWPLLIAGCAIFVRTPLMIPVLDTVPYWLYFLALGICVMAWSALMIRILTLPPTAKRFRKKRRAWSSWATVLIFLTIPAWAVVWHSDQMVDSYLRNLKVHEAVVTHFDAETKVPLSTGISHTEEKFYDHKIRWPRKIASHVGFASSFIEPMTMHYFYFGLDTPMIHVSAQGYRDTVVALPRFGELRVFMQRTDSPRVENSAER